MRSTLEKSARNQLIFREVNERIAELTGDWNETGVALFICECSNSECADSLEIRPAECYIALHDHGGDLLAEGHELSRVERARQLRAEAEALTGQAEHQVNRAKKNLRGSLRVSSFKRRRKTEGWE